MSAGKTTLGAEVAERIARPFVDVDEMIEDEVGLSIPAIFAERGEDWFREHEVRRTVEVLAEVRPRVIALGGGAVEAPAVRRALRERALTVWLDVDPSILWQRVQGSDRPLARSEDDFRARHELRRPRYRAAADVRARDADDMVLAAAGIHVQTGALELLGELVPGDGPVALVSDARVGGV